MATTTGAGTVAERSAESLWLAALPVSQPTIAAAREGVVRPALGTLTLDGAVTDMALSHDGRRLVALHYGDDAISVVDVATFTLESVVADVAEPHSVAVADRIYVTSAADAEDSVVAVDPATGFALAAKEINAAAGGLAVSTDGRTLYVARCGDAGVDIAVIDVESGAAGSIAITDAPGAVADTLRLSADGSKLYAAVTTARGSSMVVVDLRAGRAGHTFDVRGSISDIAVHRDGRGAFITGFDPETGGTLTVVDLHSGRVVRTIPVGELATQVVLAGSRAYVATGDTVAVINTSVWEVIDTIIFDRPVSCIAISRDESCLYIADYDGDITARATGVGSQLRAAS